MAGFSDYLENEILDIFSELVHIQHHQFMLHFTHQPRQIQEEEQRSAAIIIAVYLIVDGRQRQVAQHQIHRQ